MYEINKNDGTAKPNQLFISEPSNDESFYFNLDECNEEGEFAIYMYDFQNDCSYIYASNFYEFLEFRILRGHGFSSKND